jgi:hypothetical protein
MKLHSALTLLALVTAVPAAACPGPSARNEGPYRNVSPNTEAAVRRYSYSAIYDLQTYDCARITNWYQRYGWYITSYPVYRHGFGRSWHFGRGR